MMNYTIRKIISQDDIDQFKDLWCERNKRMKTPVDNQLAEFEKNLNTGIAVGAFDDDNNLVGVLRYRRFIQFPYMFLYNVHIQKNILKRYDFTNKKNPITPILDYILDEAEKDGIYTWYYIRALSKGYYKLYKEGKDLLTHSKKYYDINSNKFRYERYVEEVIYAGTYSSYPGIKKLTGDYTWKTNVALFKCELKNEYRKDGNLISEEFKYF